MHPCLAPFALALTLSGLTLSAHAPRRLEAPIRAVRLHPSEAWITRRATLVLTQAGTHALAFPKLPGDLGLDDLKVQAKGPSGTWLGEIRVGPEPDPWPETAARKAQWAKLKAVAARKAELEGRQEAAAKAGAFLDHFQEGLRGEGSRPLPAASQLLELSRGLETRHAELARDQVLRTQALEQVSEELKALEAAWQAAEAPQARNPAPAQVVVDLTLPAPGEVEVELSYRTRQTRWKPTYEARLSAEGRDLELTLDAAVTQASGEDWSQVRLELSSADPGASKAFPTFGKPSELTWIAPAPMATPAALVEVVGRVPTVDRTSVTSSMTATLNSLHPLRAAYLPPPPKPVPVLEPAATSLLVAQGLSQTWALAGTIEVPSDGTVHRFRVMAEKVHSSLAVVVVPRLDPTPFQVARFPAPAHLPLFHGAPVLRFIGDQRLGQGDLARPPAGQPYEFTLGPFQGLRASLEARSRRAPFRLAKVTAVRQSAGGTVKQSMQEEVVANLPHLQWELEDRIQLANDTDSPLTVEVRDRLPRSLHESIQIEPTAASPAPTREVAPGVAAWVLSLGPRQETALDLGWIIRGPKQGEVTGLRDLGFP